MATGKGSDKPKIDAPELAEATKIAMAGLPGGVSTGIKDAGVPKKLDRIADEIAAANIGDRIDGIASEVRASGLGQSINQAADALRNGVPVRLQRSGLFSTDDLALWLVIKRATDAISFNNYSRFMDLVLCGETASVGFPGPASPGQGFPGQRGARQSTSDVYDKLRTELRFLPFNDTDAYRLLKVATEAFLLVNGGVLLKDFNFIAADIVELNNRLGGSPFNLAELDQAWDRYLEDVNGTANATLPYLALVRSKLSGEPIKNQIFLNEDPLLPEQYNIGEKCVGVLRRKLVRPFLIELIWSYWQEEGMLVQTLNAITRRFQNLRRHNGESDPLANLEIDPLRPLHNLLWGYVQDEQHRLSVARRSYEYDHAYGISLQGKAVPTMRSADARSKFIEAFHHLLYLSSIFFKQDDDTTVIADGFPILNALREVHLILSQGAHNQFGDLPSTARQEMLLQQWLLARPEFLGFLPTRIMVAYPEPWMDRVDAMKSMQGWNDVSSLHFHNLAVFGEQVFLSIRFGAWSAVNQPAQAANWARFWRAEIQGYIHAYRAATGVDLTSSETVDSTPPSVHLRNRLMSQRRPR
jgi:hypothetical protein